MYTLADYYRDAGEKGEMLFAEGISMPWTPMPHQISGLQAAISTDRYGIYDEPGTGKTCVLQAAAMYYAHHGAKVVVVMPPPLLTQFGVSFKETFPGFEKKFHIHFLREGPAERRELFSKWNESKWPDILCMSYAMWVNAERVKSQPDSPKDKKLASDRIFQEVIKAGYKYLICDEAHALKDPGSFAYKGAREFTREQKDAGCLLATGTPQYNEVVDLYGLISLISPEKYNSKRSFEYLHCAYVMHGKNKKMVGVNNRDILHKSVYTNARRVLKDQVMTLEKPVLQELRVELHPKHKALYRKLVQERYLEVKGQLITALQQQALRQKCLQIVVNPERFTDDPVMTKCNAIRDMTEELVDSIGVRSAASQEKVVIFAHYQDSVRFIASWFPDLEPALVYGGSDTDKEVYRFLNDPKCKLMVANPKSGGVGLNLQDVCRYVIFVEPTGVPGDFKQASERVHRKGQKKTVHIYVFNAAGTISPTLTRSMLRKEVHSLSVLQDETTLLQQLLDNEIKLAA